MSTRNTKIAARHYGCKLPFEHHDAGGVVGKVDIYHMSQEEILARYGPPKMPLYKRRPAYNWKKSKKEEAKKVENLEEYKVATKPTWQEQEFDEIMDSVDAGKREQTQEPHPHKTALEVAREKITKDDYLRRKKAGESDVKIYKELKIHPGEFYVLKREWGLMGTRITTEHPAEDGSIGQKEPQEVKQAPEPDTEPEAETQTLTITEAIKLRDKYIEELEILSYMLGKATGKLQRLQEAFERETIII